MQRFAFALTLMAAVIPLAAVCSTSLETTKTRPTETDALMIELRHGGLEPRRVDHIASSFFAVPANVYQIEGGELQVYEYSNEDHAARDAASVSANGLSVGTRKVFWIAPPHFFRAKKIIVLYLGSDSRVLGILREKMGPPFAGR